MAEESSSTERSRNLWAPWRMQYIDALNDGGDGCFLCRNRQQADKDRENFTLWRGKRSFVVLNRFPYTGGHSMVAPYEHVGDLGSLDAETMRDMFCLLRDMEALLRHSLRAEGFNIGINIGRCAGAGLPGHLHIHIVPRWGGDTNFMPVLGGVRVIPQSLEALYDQLLQDAAKLKLPQST